MQDDSILDKVMNSKAADYILVGIIVSMVIALLVVIPIAIVMDIRSPDKIFMKYRDRIVQCTETAMKAPVIPVIPQVHVPAAPHPGSNDRGRIKFICEDY